MREIRDALDIADATLSFHLATLRHAGLLRCRRQGRQLIYSADYHSMQALIQFLMRDCCASDTGLCTQVDDTVSLCG